MGTLHKEHGSRRPVSYSSALGLLILTQFSATQGPRETPCPGVCHAGQLEFSWTLVPEASDQAALLIGPCSHAKLVNSARTGITCDGAVIPDDPGHSSKPPVRDMPKFIQSLNKYLPGIVWGELEGGRQEVVAGGRGQTGLNSCRMRGEREGSRRAP